MMEKFLTEALMSGRRKKSLQPVEVSHVQLKVLEKQVHKNNLHLILGMCERVSTFHWSFTMGWGTEDQTPTAPPSNAPLTHLLSNRSPLQKGAWIRRKNHQKKR